MPQWFRGFTDMQMDWIAGKVWGIRDTYKAIDGKEDTYAEFYLPGDYNINSGYIYIMLYLRIPPNTRFYGVRLVWEVELDINYYASLLQPTIAIHKSYPPATTSGGWSSDVYFATSIPFRAVTDVGQTYSQSLLAPIVFPPPYTRGTKIKREDFIDIRTGYAAFLGGSDVPTKTDLIPRAYHLINKEKVSSNGGTLQVAFSTSTSSVYPVYLRIYDIALLVPEETGDWYYIDPQVSTSPTLITPSLIDGNLSNFTTGLNNSNKVLVALFPRQMTLDRLRLYLKSDTGSPLSLRVFGDTEFNFSGTPITTITAPATPNWVDINNITIPTVLQIVP